MRIDRVWGVVGLLMTTALPSPTLGFAHVAASRVGRKQSLLLTKLSMVQSSKKQVEQKTNDLEEEAEFQKQTKALCEERNLKLDYVKNARDLSTVARSNNPVQPNKVYRMGRVSDASQDDIKLLLHDLNIKTLVDLRSPTELKDDPTLLREEVFANFTDLVWTEAKIQARKDPGCVRELEEGEVPWRKRRFRRKNDDEDEDEFICDECDIGAMPADMFFAENADRRERHFVSLMNEFKYVKGTMRKVRKRDIARSLLKSPGAIVSKRVRVSCKKPFLDEINQGGLIMLNELLLRYGAPGIKYVLDLCADPNRHPVAFYCTAGKDRTGMIAALILSLLGVPDEDIVQDYSLSANVYAEMNDHKAMVGALSQRNLDPKTFLGAPPHVMEATLKTINEKYGSVEEYLTWIGFGPESQQKLKDALTKKQ